MLTAQQSAFLESLNEAEPMDVEIDAHELPCTAANAPAAASQAPSEAGASNRTVDVSILPRQHDRGFYVRSEGRGKRLSHEQYGSALLMLVKNSSLGTPCEKNCPFKGKCGDPLTKNELYTCHEHSFGVTTNDKATGLWSCSVTADEKQDRWRTLMSSFAIYDAYKKASFAYKTASCATCGSYTRVAYGIPQLTWDKNLSLLRKGSGVMQAQPEMSTWDKAGRAARAAEQTSSRSEAVHWFMTMLSMWDAIPNEFVIVHPRVLWDSLCVSAYA
eukprot:6200168-Pleurochrysis_carterae.AAC.4